MVKDKTEFGRHPIYRKAFIWIVNGYLQIHRARDSADRSALHFGFSSDKNHHTFMEEESLCG